MEVWHAGRAGGEFERVASVDPKTATAVADGFALTATADVDLRPGVNRVRVTAVNSGGEAVAAVAVSHTPAGARVVIDAVEELGAEAKPLTRQATADGEVFGEAAGGFVEVRGRVRWATDDAAARDPGLSVVLFANQVGHLPARLDPPAGRAAERSFRVPVFLNAADTKVRVELRADGRDGPLPQQAVGGTEFRVRCKAPITQQRLHVLVVGVDVPPADRFALTQRVVASLGGTVPADRAGRFDRGEFQVGAFDRAVLYPPLVGEVDDGERDLGAGRGRAGTEAAEFRRPGPVAQRRGPGVLPGAGLGRAGRPAVAAHVPQPPVSGARGGPVRRPGGRPAGHAGGAAGAPERGGPRTRSVRPRRRGRGRAAAAAVRVEGSRRDSAGCSRCWRRRWPASEPSGTSSARCGPGSRPTRSRAGEPVEELSDELRDRRIGAGQK